MRFLYGDSSPFPHQVNLLDTIDRFVKAGVLVVLREMEARTMTAQSAANAAERERAVRALESFHGRATGDLERAAELEAPETQAYARQVVGFAERLMMETRSATEAVTAREHAALVAEVDKRRADIRTALSEFFVRAELPVIASSVNVKLGAEANTLHAAVQLPNGIVCAFELDAENVSPWGEPVRVSGIAGPLELGVGIKRSLFRRTVQLEPMSLDDYVVGSLAIADDALELRLRKRPSEPDSIILKVYRDFVGVVCEVLHPLEAEPLTTPLAKEELPKVEALWQRLRDSLEPVTHARTKLLGLVLDDEDVFDGDLAVFVLERIVAFLGPHAMELAARSPNPAEISIKIEHDGGRREESYLRKSEIRERLDLLGPAERALFAGLGFDSQ